ncbi:dUTP diphosphatase [Euzebya tangerina]|uniref:dUTP diphosphatase n=1 Tax=Euzebya tangerina TaxID=591198 RepID=UPI000E30FE5C|nr:dUTP diphosphatase [Euzebya tangerina]
MSEAIGDLPVQVVRLDPELALPTYARPGDAGLDLRAREDAVIRPLGRVLMPTGVALAIPVGYVGLVHPRSGLAVRQGLSVTNAPGTIDAGYRGEVMVPLLNTDPQTPITIHRGDRIAQLVVQQVAQVRLIEVAELDATDRGAGGFGSSG